jgi:hypothetical protein
MRKWGVLGIATIVVALGLATQAAANPFVFQGGTVVADSGFRPQANGYSFENYTNDGRPVNLTAAEMRLIFGPGVCAEGSAGGRCTLTAPARLVMNQWNQGMGHGHCYGMAATAHFFYYGIGAPPPFFGGPNTPSLQLVGNPNLQRQIAYGFVFQNFDSVNANVARGTPTQVLSATADALNSGAPVVIGFYMPDMTGGHAVTPIFIVDRGNGVFDMVVYDNNFPGALRSIVVDTNSDAWDYFGGTDPSNANSRYVGNAQTQTIELHYLAPGIGQQPCFFCRGGFSAKRAEPGQTETTLAVDSDSQGEPPAVEVSQVGGEQAGCRINDEGEMECDNAIEGADARFPFLGGVDVWDKDVLPTWTLPDGDYKVELRGGNLRGSPDEDVTLVRDGVSFALENLEVKDGERQELKLGSDELALDNEKGDDEGVRIRFGFEGESDYLFTLGVRDLEQDARFSLDLNRKRGDLALETKGDDGRYSLEVERTTGARTVEVADGSIKSKPGDELTVDFDHWRKGDDSAPLD